MAGVFDGGMGVWVIILLFCHFGSPLSEARWLVSLLSVNIGETFDLFSNFEQSPKLGLQQTALATSRSLAPSMIRITAILSNNVCL